MTLPLRIFSKSYQYLFDLLCSIIPNFSQIYTNRNTSDPGIMLIEILAYLGQIILYRMDKLPDQIFANFIHFVAGVSADETIDRSLYGNRLEHSEEESLRIVDYAHRRLLKFLAEMNIRLHEDSFFEDALLGIIIDFWKARWYINQKNIKEKSFVSIHEPIQIRENNIIFTNNDKISQISLKIPSLFPFNYDTLLSFDKKSLSIFKNIAEVFSKRNIVLPSQTVLRQTEKTNQSGGKIAIIAEPLPVYEKLEIICSGNIVQLLQSLQNDTNSAIQNVMLWLDRLFLYEDVEFQKNLLSTKISEIENKFSKKMLRKIIPWQFTQTFLDFLNELLSRTNIGTILFSHHNNDPIFSEILRLQQAPESFQPKEIRLLNLAILEKLYPNCLYSTTANKSTDEIRNEVFKFWQAPSRAITEDDFHNLAKHITYIDAISYKVKEISLRKIAIETFPEKNEVAIVLLLNDEAKNNLEAIFGYSSLLEKSLKEESLKKELIKIVKTFFIPRLIIGTKLTDVIVAEKFAINLDIKLSFYTHLEKEKIQETQIKVKNTIQKYLDIYEGGPKTQGFPYNTLPLDYELREQILQLQSIKDSTVKISHSSLSEIKRPFLVVISNINFLE